MSEPFTIRLVIPDTGILISLAHGNLLDVLLSFRPNVELVVTDVVAYEATRKRDQLDAQRISAFLEENKDRINIDPTAFSALIERAKQDPTIELPRDAGEMSIYAYIKEIRRLHPGIPTLVLFEDNWFIRNEARPRNIHLVSLAAFFKVLEERVPGFVAKEAMARIQHTRPDVQKIEIDQPSESGTEWHSTLGM